MKIIYLNFGVKNYRKVDHCSYRRNFLQLQKERLKKIQACTGFEPLTSVIPVQHSYKLQANWEQIVICELWGELELYESTSSQLQMQLLQFFFWLSFCNCCVVISNPAYTISNSKHETSVAPSAIIDTNLRDLP